MALQKEILVEEILMRLPVKYLVRCRSVCKSWNSLISAVCKSWNSLFSDPEFIKSHLSQSPEDGDDYLILNTLCHHSSANDPYNYISIISHANLSEARIDKLPFPKSSKRIHLVASINGLVCIARVSELDFDFTFWNPVISQFKKTVKPVAFGSFFRCQFGFGWDSVANDYKLIVKCSDSSKIDVYSCKADTWLEKAVPKQFLKPCKSVVKYWTPSTVVKGCPYWTGSLADVIVKFEVRNEEFIILPIPGCRPFRLVNLNESLVLIQSGSCRKMDVYNFNEEFSFWSKTFSINFKEKISMCFKYGGEIVFNGKKKLYDHKSNKIKNLVSYDDKGSFVNGFSYRPSLVALEGMKSLHARGRKRPLCPS